MKDIVITGKDIRRELLIFLWCVVAMTIVNAICIASYKTLWSELYSVWYAVLLVAAILYIILIPLRYLGCRIGKAFKRSSRK